MDYRPFVGDAARPDNLTTARSGSRAVRAVGVRGKKGKGAARGVTAVKKGGYFCKQSFPCPPQIFHLAWLCPDPDPHYVRGVRGIYPYLSLIGVTRPRRTQHQLSSFTHNMHGDGKPTKNRGLFWLVSFFLACPHPLSKGIHNGITGGIFHLTQWLPTKLPQCVDPSMETVVFLIIALWR